MLYLVGQDQNRAYDICASSFAEAIRESPRPGQEEALMIRLIGIAVEKCRNIKTIPTFDVIEFLDISSAEKGQLLIVLKALQAQDFEVKAFVLLRDQLSLSYRQIATIIRSSESNTRSKVTQARARLRKMIEDTLNYA